MIQMVTPNFGVGATRGWCLKYVDDAGNAPTRRATAKAAFYAENSAGRIRGGDSPINVWVVGFLDFTSGPYTREGHVFFRKHLGGGRYEIRDSEVGAGARRPYGSLAELIGWFGAYKPRDIGWSTDCDGRNYAKEGDKEVKIGPEGNWRWRMNRLHRQLVRNADVGDETFNAIVGQDAWNVVENWSDHPESEGLMRWQQIGQVAEFENWAGQIANLQTQLSELGKRPTQEQLDALVKQSEELSKSAESANAKAEKAVIDMKAAAEKARLLEEQQAADKAAGDTILRRIGQFINKYLPGGK